MSQKFSIFNISLDCSAQMLLGSISFIELPPTTVLEQAVICGGLVSDEGPVELGGGPPGPEADVA